MPEAASHVVTFMKQRVVQIEDNASRHHIGRLMKCSTL